MPTAEHADQAHRSLRRDTSGQDHDSVQVAAQELPRDAAAILRLQHAVGNRAVSRLIQRHCYEQFGSYADAKAANKYSQALLDDQKDDKIQKHERAKFSGGDIFKILNVNKAASGRNAIVSDRDASKVLTRQDLDKTPHVDHRFPKSKGGTNSYKNARIISAKENIAKSATTDLKGVPDEALDPYKALDDTNVVIQKFGEFTPEQKSAIYLANEMHYGKLKSDSTKAELGRIDSSAVPHIDHIVPKSEGGCNYYFNASVLPADVNIDKGGMRKKFGKLGEFYDESGDYEIGEMTLEKYYEKKQAGTVATTKHKGGGKSGGRGKVRGENPY
jgi:5-methylcytosine-specific restriction endonuclease McrA